MRPIYGVAPRSANGAPGKLRSRWPEGCALSAYSALLAFAIPFHEPFADEAQGWQLARNLPLTSLFKTYIRYAAAPGLWHFLLWILIRAHVSYAGLHWISGAIAGPSVTALLLFKSPFPLYLKLALPFTVFLVYQYAVVARNYVLAPILLYAIAFVWKKNPLILALLLGLLANVALHAVCDLRRPGHRISRRAAPPSEMPKHSLPASTPAGWFSFFLFCGLL